MPPLGAAEMMKPDFLQICISGLCSPLDSLMSKQQDSTSASPLMNLLHELLPPLPDQLFSQSL